MRKAITALELAIVTTVLIGVGALASQGALQLFGLLA
jgi:hypothetical protein